MPLWSVMLPDHSGVGAHRAPARVARNLKQPPAPNHEGNRLQLPGSLRSKRLDQRLHDRHLPL